MSCSVIGLGLRCLDITILVGVSSDGKREREALEIAVQGGGPAGTAAVAAARLGVRAGYVGTVGSDALGELKYRTLADYGVDLQGLIRRDSPEHQVALVFVSDESGERRFMPNRRLREAPLGVAELDRPYLTAADILIVDGFHPEAALAAAAWMRSAGKQVLLDLQKPECPIPPVMDRLVPASDILICGEGALRAITGMEDPLEAGKNVLAMGVKIVVETWGERGSLTVIPGEHFVTPAFQVEVINTTGAGDVFHGAYAAGLLEGWDLRRIARFASAAAALTCTRRHGFERIPDRAAVERLLHRQGGRG